MGSWTHHDGAGLRPTDDVDSEEDFAAWVERFAATRDTSVPVGE